MNIVFFPFYSAWDSYVRHEYEVSLSFLSKGHSITWVVCDSALALCDTQISYAREHNLAKDDVCSMCISNRNRYIRLLSQSKQFTLLKLEKGLEDTAQSVLKNWCRASDVTLGTEWRIGLDGISLITNISKPNLKEQKGLSRSFFIIYTYVLRIFLLGAFDVAIFSHSHRTQMSAIALACEQLGLPYLSYVDAGVNGFYYCDHLVSLSSPENLEMTRPTNPGNLPDISIDASYQAILEYVINHSVLSRFADALPWKEAERYLRPINQAENFNTLANQLRPIVPDATWELSLILHKFSDYAAVVVFCGNTHSEGLCSTSTSSEIAQVRISNAIYSLARVNKDILFVLRDHPNRWKSKAGDEEADYAISLKNAGDHRVSKNIIHIASHDRVNTHVLLAHCNLVIAPYSSIALDASVLGIPVAVSSYSHYSYVADFIVETKGLSTPDIAESVQKILDILEFNQPKTLYTAHGPISREKLAALFYGCKHGYPYFLCDITGYYRYINKAFDELVSGWIYTLTNSSFAGRQTIAWSEYVARFYQCASDQPKTTYCEGIETKFVEQTIRVLSRNIRDMIREESNSVIIPFLNSDHRLDNKIDKEERGCVLGPLHLEVFHLTDLCDLLQERYLELAIKRNTYIVGDIVMLDENGLINEPHASSPTFTHLVKRLKNKLSDWGESDIIHNLVNIFTCRRQGGQISFGCIKIYYIPAILAYVKILR